MSQGEKNADTFGILFFYFFRYISAQKWGATLNDLFVSATAPYATYAASAENDGIYVVPPKCAFRNVFFVGNDLCVVPYKC